MSPMWVAMLAPILCTMPETTGHYLLGVGAKIKFSEEVIEEESGKVTYNVANDTKQGMKSLDILAIQQEITSYRPTAN